MIRQVCPLVSLARLQQRLDGQRNRGGRRIALPRDVARDHDAARQFQSAEHGVGDPHVRLVRSEDVQILGAYAGGIQGLSGRLRHRVGGPLEDWIAFHPQRRPIRLALGGPVRLLSQASAASQGSVC